MLCVGRKCLLLIELFSFSSLDRWCHSHYKKIGTLSILFAKWIQGTNCHVDPHWLIFYCLSFTKKQKKLEVEIVKVKHVALTTDGWTSAISDPYITVTIHYVNSNFKFVTRILNTTYLPVTHTSMNIAEYLRKVASQWDIQDKVIAVVTENAANMKEAIKLCGWRNVTCFAHTLNLAVTNAIDSNPEFKSVLSNCRAVVTFFKQSPKQIANWKRWLPIIRLKL